MWGLLTENIGEVTYPFDRERLEVTYPSAVTEAGTLWLHRTPD